MIEGKDYIERVTNYFGFLNKEFNYVILEEKIRGNAFYDVQYRTTGKIISISYENIEDYLLIVIYLLVDGQLPDFDDSTRTLHLNKLNALLVPMVNKQDIEANATFFSDCQQMNNLERRLLKAAKELRICLKYFYKLVKI